MSLKKRGVVFLILALDIMTVGLLVTTASEGFNGGITVSTSTSTSTTLIPGQTFTETVSTTSTISQNVTVGEAIQPALTVITITAPDFNITATNTIYTTSVTTTTTIFTTWTNTTTITS